MEHRSSSENEVIARWGEMADQLTSDVATAPGLMSVPMAQALHLAAQAETDRTEAATPAAQPGWDDWWEKRQGLAARAFSVQELAKRSLDRLAGVNASTAACVALREQPALEHARVLDQRLADGETLGLLGGMPLAHKDLLHRQGEAVGYGMAQPVSSGVGDATVLRRFDQADALHLARLHMTELAFDPSGTNQASGDCRNPWSLQRIPGGSSSGSAAVVAAGAVEGALGSDTGGSIRIPAALCGVTGLKPTFGLVSRTGAMSLSATLDHLGPIARSARDCALMLQAIAGYDVADAGSVVAPRDASYVDGLDGAVTGLRIGVPQGYFDAGLDPRIQAVMARSGAAFKAVGAELCAVPDFAYDAINEMAIMMIRAEATALYDRWVRPGNDGGLGEFTWTRLQEGVPIPASLYLRAAALRGPLLCRFVQTVMADVDVLMAPVFPLPTPRIEVFDSINPESSRLRRELTRLTRPINYLGLPSLSLPGGVCEPDDESVELPVGFQLIGRPFSEALLLRLGHAFQKTTPWHLRRPPAAV